jgi:hypothetical protein
MKNGSCALRAILKRLRRKKEFLSRIVDPFVCVLFFPPKALINPSEGRSFNFDFLILGQPPGHGPVKHVKHPQKLLINNPPRFYPSR